MYSKPRVVEFITKKFAVLMFIIAVSTTTDRYYQCQ